jgi:phosphate starvation-inducible protein PhoH and related proteins
MLMKLPKNNLFYGLADKMTDEQSDYVHKIFNNDITFCNAIPGSGKTTMAVAAGRYLVESKLKRGIIYIFSPVEEDTMGHRPGDQNEKEEAYLGPLKDALSSIGFQPDIINRETGWVFGKSHTFLRGTNLENYVIIIDEAQNYTKKELKKVLTRIHTSCTVIVIGHSGQCDLKFPWMSGFVPQLKHFRGQEGAGVAELTEDFRGWVSKHADALEDDQRGPFKVILDKFGARFRKRSK